MCFNAINEGANGVDMGRNIFQSDAPVAMMRAVQGVVHGSLNPKKAFEMYNDLKSDRKKAK